jgi:hypothetical protein
MNLKLNKSPMVFFVLLFAVVLAPVTGLSQQQDIYGKADQLEISDKELMVFVKVQKEVVGLQQKYSEMASQAKDVDKQNQIVEEANEKMVEAAAKEGFSVERYNIITSAAQSDTALQQRIIVASQKLK